MLRNALISLTIFILLTGQACAGIIGGLNARSMDAVSIKLEAIYVVVLSEGVVPVQSYTVQPDDTVEGIFRNVMGFAGAYFPVLLDAITCDLNPQICRRVIEPVDDLFQKGGAVQTIGSPLQVQATPGDWSGLQAGQELIIPSISILQRVTPQTYEKSSGETIAAIIEANEVCRSGTAYIDNCVSYFDFLNGAIKGYGDGYAGTIQVPAFDYLIHIPEDCEALCASVAAPIVVDLYTQSYVSAPYAIATAATTPDNPAWNAATWEKYFGHTDCPNCLDVTVDANAAGMSLQLPNEANMVVLPAEIQDRYDLGTGIVGGQTWTRDLQLSPFAENFHPKQKQSVAVMDILTEMPPGPPPARQAVMIIDSRFDQLHCEFKPENFVVYDCSQFPTSLTATCEKKDPSIDYFSLSDLPSPPLAGPESATRAMVEEARPRCDAAAGALAIENPGDDPDFIKAYHGTHLAGIIGAAWDGHGGGGVNPFIRIVGVEIETDFLGDEQYAAWLNSQLLTIIPNETVSVVNISLGDADPLQASDASLALDGDDWLSDVISQFSNRVLFVVAAGNTQDPEGVCQTLPACLATDHSNVAAVVGMAEGGDEVLDGLNSNPAFTVGAVARNVFGTIPLNRYAEMSGSSQSAAYVSGAASLAMAFMGTGWPIRDRIIACSNIASEDLQKSMMGGILDAGCLINGERDLIVTDVDDPPLSINVMGLKASEDAPPIVAQFPFFDMAQNTEVQVIWDRVLGFQQVGDNRVVLFRSRNGEDFGPIERLYGQFLNNPYMQLATGGETLAFSEVHKYVRRR